MATAAQLAHRRCCNRLIVCRAPLPSAHPARRDGRPHRLKPRRLSVRRSASIRKAAGRCCFGGFGVMCDKVRRRIALRDTAGMRSICLCVRLRACTHPRKSHSEPQQRDSHRGAHNVLCAYAGFRLSVAPLRHHHHKFLRWPRSRRASSGYPLPIGHGSSDSDAHTLIATTTGLRPHNFSCFRNITSSRYIGGTKEIRFHDVQAACR
jgi:hypothetical protein